MTTTTINVPTNCAVLYTKLVIAGRRRSQRARAPRGEHVVHLHVLVDVAEANDVIVLLVLMPR